jgi:hypothetical protein
MFHNRALLISASRRIIGGAPPPPVLDTNYWNAADKASNITISGTGDLIATKTGSSGHGSVRTIGATTQPFYFEFTQGTVAYIFGPGVGVTGYNGTLTSDPGSDATIITARPGGWIIQSGSVGSCPTWSAGDTIAVAVNPITRKIWLKNITTGGDWNSSGSNDPAAGTGGTNIGTGIYFPYYATFGSIDTLSGEGVTANFGATSYAGTPPSGFGNMPDFAETALDVANAGPQITVSQGGLRAACGLDFANDSVRATQSRSVDKVYWETTNVSRNVGGSGMMGGVCNASAVMSGTDDGNTAKAGYAFYFGAFYWNAGFAYNHASMSNDGTDTFGFALDAANSLLWVKNITDGSNWNANGSADPATGTGGINLRSGPTGADMGAPPYYACAYMPHSPDSGDFNFGATAFVGTIPTGFVPYNEGT